MGAVLAGGRVWVGREIEDWVIFAGEWVWKGVGAQGDRWWELRLLVDGRGRVSRMGTVVWVWKWAMERQGLLVRGCG